MRCTGYSVMYVPEPCCVMCVWCDIKNRKLKVMNNLKINLSMDELYLTVEDTDLWMRNWSINTRSLTQGLPSWIKTGSTLRFSQPERIYKNSTLLCRFFGCSR